MCHLPAAGRSRLLVGGSCSVEIVHASELPVSHPPSSRPRPAAGWRPVQCRGRPYKRASRASPHSSQLEPAAGWRPVQCRGLSRQRASCAPPPSRHPEPAAGWRPVYCCMCDVSITESKTQVILEHSGLYDAHAHDNGGSKYLKYRQKIDVQVAPQHSASKLCHNMRMADSLEKRINANLIRFI